MPKVKVELYKKCYIGLGSNQGDSKELLSKALQELDLLPCVRVVAVSPLYFTEPQNDKEQAWFFNQAARLDCALSALELLDALQAIEAKLGRERAARRYGPRSIDLDLLLYGSDIIAHERLTVPHPRLCERAFALVPLADLEPDLRLPDGSSIAALLEKLDYTLTGDKISQSL